jgi:hypothetical protein
MRRLLLLAAVFGGLFVMHGVQATPSPVQASGAMVGSTRPDPGMRTTPAAVHAMAEPSHGPGGHSGHSHPGGTICLALLVLAGLVLLTAAGHIGLRPPRPAGRPLPLGRRGPPRARPPTVYQLSVLRL